MLSYAPTSQGNCTLFALAGVKGLVRKCCSQKYDGNAWRTS